MLQAAFGDHPRVKIQTFERDLWRLFPTYRPCEGAASHEDAAADKHSSSSNNNNNNNNCLRSEAETYPGTLHLVRRRRRRRRSCVSSLTVALFSLFFSLRLLTLLVLCFCPPMNE